MSVIFEALQKLRLSEAQDDHEAPKPLSRGNARSTSKILVSALCLVILLVAAAAGFIYIYWDEESLSGRRDAVAVTLTPGQGEVSVSRSAPAKDPGEQKGSSYDEMEPPPSISYKKPQKGRLYLPKERAAGINSPQGTVQASPTPPLPRKEEDITSAPILDKIEERAQPPFVEMKEETTHVPHLETDQGAGLNTFAASKRVNPFLSPLEKGEGSDPLSVEKGDKRVVAALSGIRKTPSAAMTEPRRSQESLKKQGKDPQESVSHKRTHDVASIVTRLQASLMGGSPGEVEDLLARLEDLKGSDDPFVLKIKAYWFTRQGKFSRARKYLKTVLQQDPFDVEAGINMAILEIKTGKRKEGVKRLKKLQEIYPENDVINDLLAKTSG